ncbi:hypothetical protein M0R45_019212 [Rubus argutus]|uniref:Uncharacterized protein n=1 Tax=Rubus argutus TaxID=59490 RepID=A0AAW1X4T3_RUBAR
MALLSPPRPLPLLPSPSSVTAAPLCRTISLSPSESAIAVNHTVPFSSVGVDSAGLAASNQRKATNPCSPAQPGIDLHDLVSDQFCPTDAVLLTHQTNAGSLCCRDAVLRPLSTSISSAQRRRFCPHHRRRITAPPHLSNPTPSFPISHAVASHAVTTSLRPLFTGKTRRKLKKERNPWSDKEEN